MYETFFGLKRRPFLAVPDTDSYFSIARMEEARQSIERIVRRGEGISLIVGPSGTGKTLLLRLLRKTLDVEYTVCLVANGHLETPKAFFQQLLYELRLPFSITEETELRLMLQDFARQETTPGIVLLIDEAQFLGADVLEEIRFLMNSDDGAVPFFRAILAGNAEFEEKLTHPKFEAFNQRIASRFYLDTLTREETFRYVSWQTVVSRGRKESLPNGLAEYVNNSASVEGRRLDAPHVKSDEPIFTEKARYLIFKLTGGLPRLVNQLCDAAMQLAAERVSRQVDETIVQSAWAKFQQIDETILESETRQLDRVPESSESVEEIVARKKATFQLKKFDSSVEFGTLDGPVAETRSFNEYKPPYPEDDDDGDEKSAEASIAVETENETVDDTEADAVLAEAVPEATRPEEICPDDDEGSIPTLSDERILYQIAPLEKVRKDEAPVERVLYEIIPLEKPPVAAAPVAEIPVEEIPVAEIPVEEIPVAEIPVEAAVDVGDALSPERRPGPVVSPIRLRKRKTTFSKKPGTFFPLSLTLWSFDFGDRWIGNVTAHPRFLPVRLFLAPFGIGAEEIPENVNHVDESVSPATESFSNTNIDRTVPDIDSEESPEETPMDQETLERYGTEVLEGRPPFVRKEPNYAYQTTESAPQRNVLPYPDPLTGAVILLNWILPDVHDFPCGVGTTYSEFVSRAPSEVPKPVDMPQTLAEEQNGAANDRTVLSRADDLETSRVVRVHLSSPEKTDDASQEFGKRKTCLDESFDEVARMVSRVVSLDEVYRVADRFSAPEIPCTPMRIPLEDDAFRLQLDAAVRRIVDAAEKIEQAAETTEDAGRHFKETAVFVETEIQAALPTYKDLFVELSEFQKTISAELRNYRDTSPPVDSVPPVSSVEPTMLPPQRQARREEHRGRLLPFPRRPDFIPTEPPSGTDRENENATEERSIDVRTLFQ